MKSQNISSKIDIWKMFNEIAPTYDFINRILSFGIDTYWRNQLKHFLPAGSHLQLVDLATGTGDQIFSLMKTGRIEYALGIDLAEAMLKIAEKKTQHLSHSNVEFKEGSATNVPLKECVADCTTISFGIRNIDKLELCLAEMYRILKPSGRALILEFSLPTKRWVRTGNLFYLRKILPLIGKLISKHQTAYRYLNETIETFPSGASFCTFLEKAGFVNVKHTPLTGGIATVYQGDKCEGLLS